MSGITGMSAVPQPIRGLLYANLSLAIKDVVSNYLSERCQKIYRFAKAAASLLSLLATAFAVLTSDNNARKQPRH